MPAALRSLLVVVGTLAVHAGIWGGMRLLEQPLIQDYLVPRPNTVAITIEPVPDPVPVPVPVPVPDPDPVAEPEPEAEPPPPAPKAPPPPSRTRAAPARTAAAATSAEPPPDTAVTENAGGAPTLQMPDLASGTGAVAVAKGPPRRGGGRGGSGTGTGTGTGTGSEAGSAPVSVAAIKTKAMPRGDYSFLELGKDYPEAAKRLGVAGRIRVRLTVDATGKVTSARLLNKLGHGLDELALARARKIEFTPARDTNDRAVASIVVWTFDFELPD